MTPRVKYVRYIADYRLELGFTDGLRTEIDLRNRIVDRGGVFRPLSDFDFFKQVQVEPEAETIVWPNGVDFCPDVLYCIATGQAVETLQAEGSP